MGTKRRWFVRKRKVSKAEKRAAAKIFKAASMYLKRYGTLVV
jgi:hypothetical protein